METAYLCLGKTGDILSALQVIPVGSNVVVSRRYAPVLDGINWVKPVVYEGEWDDLHGAIRFAKQNFRRVINLATFGKNFPIQHRTPSFQHDQWLRASGNGKNGAGFDLGYTCNAVPTFPGAILIADHSESSPFPHKDDLYKLVQERFGADRKIVRLSEIKVPNFKDFLALYHAADLLITVETAHLHLSAATLKPVIAFVTDLPQKWHGSAWSERFAFYCRYGEYEERKSEFLHVAESVLNKQTRPLLTFVKTDHVNAYNPSIIQHDGKRFMAYRHHPETNRWRTELAITDGIKTWQIEMPQEVSAQSCEDPRLFLCRGKLCMSYTVSRYGDSPVSMMAYGELEWKDDKCRVVNHAQPLYGKNDFSASEKNWTWFEYKNDLYVTYQHSPEHIVLKLDRGKVVQEYKTKTPAFAFGHPRGGTQPMPYKGQWLKFCHSQSVNQPDRGKWLYHCLGLTMEPQPPFQITSISSFPILTGSEEYFHGWQYWKPRIVFPAGAVQNGAGWDVSLGWNDSACAILHVKPEQLLL